MRGQLFFTIKVTLSGWPLKKGFHSQALVSKFPICPIDGPPRLPMVAYINKRGTMSSQGGPSVRHMGHLITIACGSTVYVNRQYIYEGTLTQNTT